MKKVETISMVEMMVEIIMLQQKMTNRTHNVIESHEAFPYKNLPF